ncbi:hypothetical protein D7V64_04455 [Acinetobacter cumulans]|uniref:DUF4234 domain-containing protein n=1 Tax=Acinetobacter cumulans TaxID=2136182 RepID=A0A3A8GID6_9GAMM|nr:MULTISPECIES: hypothetical protein [Acinetobacter]NWK72972.1 hypothetical protein [Acinetobacter sp. SwsAc6]QCO20325.1 hypothetical protein C9E88_001700 [Acinetobacter cumulans]RKG43400.1 hypothetical protein D7V51_09415 [Acinetobacter cumulans]RKG51291.1 hypothetical protein D7V68_01295 [Acinetobacter cumulans]RKG54824.1 hypothetical protein D7V64_04455 [Acinetobacter cumulans]
MSEIQLQEKPLKLWNPNAAGCWALLVSPICSSYLLYKNAQKLNDRGAASKAKNWMIAGLAVWLLSVICSLAYPTNTAMVNGFFFWYLILWYFLFVRQQVANMRQRFGESYVRYTHFEWFKFVMIGLVVRVVLMGLSLWLSALWLSMRHTVL